MVKLGPHYFHRYPPSSAAGEAGVAVARALASNPAWGLRRADQALDVSSRRILTILLELQEELDLSYIMISQT